MKIKLKQKIKEFYKKHKVVILLGGTIITGFIIITIVRSKKGKTQEIEELQQWTDQWIDNCDVNNLLYENGLPIFADDDMTIVYRDALADDYSIQEAEENGFTIIDRA
jgi:hypothetical protein